MACELTGRRFSFFVAIIPSRRPEWGRKMQELVKPGGYLITLVFPIFAYHETGPPFWVLPEHYDEVLGDGWEKVVDEVIPNDWDSRYAIQRVPDDADPARVALTFHNGADIANAVLQGLCELAEHDLRRSPRGSASTPASVSCGR